MPDRREGASRREREAGRGEGARSVASAPPRRGARNERHPADQAGEPNSERGSEARNEPRGEREPRERRSKPDGMTERSEGETEGATERTRAYGPARWEKRESEARSRSETRREPYVRKGLRDRGEPGP